MDRLNFLNKSSEPNIKNSSSNIASNSYTSYGAIKSYFRGRNFRAVLIKRNKCLHVYDQICGDEHNN